MTGKEKLVIKCATQMMFTFKTKAIFIYLYVYIMRKTSKAFPMP